MKVLIPVRPLWKIGTCSPALIGPESITAATIGMKAYGLATLPQEWVPKYFVIEAPVLNTDNEVLQGWIKETLVKVSIEQGSVIVRSSGVTETLMNRGRLVSGECTTDKIIDTIKSLSSQVPKQLLTNVHWIVQTNIPARRKGHLSNERHLSRENRDWIVEVELQGNRLGYHSSIGIRRWRDGISLSDLDMSCVSEPQITLCLRKVAHWATLAKVRIHFEWVWDGSAVWLVQADCEEEVGGIEPTSMMPREVKEPLATNLSTFKTANAKDYESLAKLKNASLYSRLGYQMPQFFILEDQKIIKEILQGRVPSELDSDLDVLTNSPLILRTDGYNIPLEKREMLPRSDELRTTKSAKEWLVNTFRDRITESGLLSTSICLIGHHFLPSPASAWAAAEPGKRMVRIESLWGLPEGLYWYSHDTFEVDVQTGDPDVSKKQSYKIYERLRYKNTFIAPDLIGRWIPMHTCVPYDWRPSIKKKKWICEIAHNTRRIADQEKCPTVVMWFIDIDKRLSKNRVLPWFHSRWELGGVPKAAPRRKRSTARDYVINNRTNWDELKQSVLRGTRIERIIVKPEDPELIRSPAFAEELGAFANTHRIVVELAGGILSHVYYVLRRAGAQVECTDLAGAEEEVIEYNKIVRDKIPSIIEGRNEKVDILQLSGDALVAALRQKIVEEAYEVLDAKAGTEILTELADVQEVINAIARAIKISLKKIELERIEKRNRRGGFEQGYILRRTSSPHTLSTKVPIADVQTGSISPHLELRLGAVAPAEIPANAPYQRPDLRSIDQQAEKLFVFENELNKIGHAKASTTFEFPLEDGATRNFTLSIEFDRVGAIIRGDIRLRVHPQQMTLEIPDQQLELVFKDEKSKLK